jgi:hypothetical protein
VIFQNTSAVKGYIDQLRRQYILEAYKQEFSEASVDLAKEQDKHYQLVSEYNSMKGPDLEPGLTYETSENTAKGDKKDEIVRSSKELLKIQSVYDAIQKKIEASLNFANDLTPKITTITAPDFRTGTP